MRRGILSSVAMCSAFIGACGGGGSSPTAKPPSASVNQAPTVEAGNNQSVSVGETVTLSGIAEDADGSIASWSWTQTAGRSVSIENADTAMATFKSPDLASTETLVFALTVTDNAGATASDSLEVEVAPAVPVTISAKPEPLSKDAFALFEFNGEGATGYECSFDLQDYAFCTSPHYIMPVSVGEHTLDIRALGETSAAGPSTRVYWTVSSLFGDHFNAEVDAELIPTTQQPSGAEPNSWRGILRINCDFSHADYVDPIVFPGMDGAAHLHRFYGNMLLDADTTLESLFTTGDSSCQGNDLNRSAYWIPALIAPDYDPDTGTRRLDSLGDPAFKVVPAVVGNDDVAHEVFYYSAGVDDLDSIQPIPLGLRMIAGDGSTQPGQEQSSAIVRWHCQSWESSDATNPRWSATIPECVAPDRLRMDIFFPSCWNGETLDSSDHKSHLAYPETINSSGSATTVCPASHPVPILRVSFHYAWGVLPEYYDPATRSSKGWRITSDAYDLTDMQAGGLSLHGDWFNAWHPEALQAILEHCVKGQLDCHDGNLANGYRLSGTRAGTQSTPEVLNLGHGSGAHDN